MLRYMMMAYDKEVWATYTFLTIIHHNDYVYWVATPEDKFVNFKQL